jgi:hypothetical protein
MTLNLAEAHAVNVLIRHLAGDDDRGTPAPDRDVVIEQLALLADAAHKKLGAGYDADRARLALNANWSANEPIARTPATTGAYQRGRDDAIAAACRAWGIRGADEPDFTTGLPTTEDNVATCITCGCTEDAACAWLPNPLMVDLCTACAGRFFGANLNDTTTIGDH